MGDGPTEATEVVPHPAAGERDAERGAPPDGARDAGPPRGFPARAWRFLTRARGNRLWDAVVRGTGALGLLGIGLVLLVPAAGPLVGFGIVTIWITGPLSPLFPVGYEPILMLFGRVYAPLLIAAVSMVVQLYVEFTNYHLHRKVLELDVTRRFRESRIVDRLRELFDRRPFFTVWLCSWSPVPYWVVRILGPLSGYPVKRYLAATVLGRFPKLWFFAALGTFWSVSDRLLLAVVAGSLVVGLALYGRRRWFGEEDEGKAAARPGSGGDALERTEVAPAPGAPGASRPHQAGGNG